jgi:hypothetical protein
MITRKARFVVCLQLIGDCWRQSFCNSDLKISYRATNVFSLNNLLGFGISHFDFSRGVIKGFILS